MPFLVASGLCVPKMSTDMSHDPKISEVRTCVGVDSVPCALLRQLYIMGCQ